MTVTEVLPTKRKDRRMISAKSAVYPVSSHDSFSEQSQPPTISVIMPAFNEEETLDNLLTRTEKILKQFSEFYEIIVINDGSKDNTFHICQGRNVVVIHNHLNHGKGYALREGFKFAQGDIIITIDSDGDHYPEEIPLLLQPILNGHADAVLGSRFLQNGHGPITSAVNSLGNRLFNFLIRHLTHRQFTDTQCGFRAFTRSCLSKLDPKAAGFQIETEMVVQLARHNISYREVPIRSKVASLRKSHLNRFLDGFRILFTIFKTRLKKTFKK